MFFPLVPAFNLSINRLALIIIIIVGVFITSGLVYFGVKYFRKQNKTPIQPTNIKIQDDHDKTMKITDSQVQNNSSDTLKSGVSGTEALISDKSKISMHSRSESHIGLTPRKLVTSIQSMASNNFQPL